MRRYLPPRRSGCCGLGNHPWWVGITAEHLQWADVVCTGGMLAQQPGIMRVMELAREAGKYTVVGGPDPTSQPDLYEAADALVVGEGESSIPVWLRSWQAGELSVQLRILRCDRAVWAQAAREVARAMGGRIAAAARSGLPWLGRHRRR